MADVQDSKGAFKIDYDLWETHIVVQRRNTIDKLYKDYGLFVWLIDCRGIWAWNFNIDHDSLMDATEMADVLYLMSQLKTPTVN